MAYNVGGLEIDITGAGISNTQSLNDLRTLTSRINSLQKAMAGLNETNTATATKNVKELLYTINKSINQSEVTPQYGIYNISKNLSDITYNKGNNNIFSLKNLFNFGKLRFTLHYAKRIANTIAQIAKSGSDYLETLNLWAIAMRQNLDIADQFINKISKAYGISETTLMNAQATFKNMIGSLGQIGEDTAYKLSESVTQMAIDYASLYNVSIESAFNKFQAALAGQVRPIRSVSGYDITETTLYDLYQSIGGTKTMRQLNRTEKQLLSILAIYKQMGVSGAAGDMAKTINQFANQSRIMTEQWERIKIYSGILVRNFIDSNQILIYINASLITISEILKAIANATSDTSPDQFLDNLFEDATETNEVIDELQGKLLDFDKIRALDTTATDSVISIDETVLNALSNYTSTISDANSKAQELANTWLKNLGLVDENNDGILDINKSLTDVLSTLESIGISLVALTVIFGISKIITLISTINLATLSAKAFSAVINVAVIAGIYLLIDSIIKLVKNWDNMTNAERAARIGLAVLGIALITFYTLSKIAIANTTALTTALILQKAAAIGLSVGGIALLVANISLLVGAWDKMNTAEKVVGVFGAIGAAALAAAAAIAAFHGAWTVGTATIAIIGGLAAITAAFIGFKASMKDLSIPEYANGGVLPDKGTLFVAGESGAEIVYNSGAGNGGIANVQQIAQATYQGTMSALEDWWGGMNAKKDIPQLKEANATGLYQTVTGVARSYGNKWTKA